MSEIKIEDLIQGKIRTLSKAITLTESLKPEHQKLSQDLIEKALAYSGKSIRIGISGTPGVGKSSLIETIGLALANKGHKVAVLAIDPSSPISGGSILGDKTRMEKLSQHANAFIRPSPTAGTLGGVAQKTREAMILCEAAGFDVILIETVGVGQSEYEVSNMVDIFTVVLQPGSGDELQGIKKGIIEVANFILINKSEDENRNKAISTQTEYTSAINISAKDDALKTKVLLVSALKNLGIEEFWQEIENHVTAAKKLDIFQNKRIVQNKRWLKNLFNQMIEERINSNDELKKQWHTFEEEIVQNKSNPYKCAKKLIDILFQGL